MTVASFREFTGLDDCILLFASCRTASFLLIEEVTETLRECAGVRYWGPKGEEEEVRVFLGGTCRNVEALVERCDVGRDSSCGENFGDFEVEGKSELDTTESSASGGKSVGILEMDKNAAESGCSWESVESGGVGSPPSCCLPTSSSCEVGVSFRAGKL
jgi:hypothetical protein